MKTYTANGVYDRIETTDLGAFYEFIHDALLAGDIVIVDNGKKHYTLHPGKLLHYYTDTHINFGFSI